MEHQTTKIPRLRELRYAKNQTTCLDLKLPRIQIENQAPQMKRTISLTQIFKHKPLMPEQFNVKYKNYAHKYCKRSCIICGMRKPQLKKKDTKSERSKVQCSSICIQTPFDLQTETWDAQTQTKDFEPVQSDSGKLQTPTEVSQGKALRYLRTAISIGAWFSLFIAIFAIGAVFAIKQIDVLKWVTRKQLRQPKTLMEKILAYFHRDKILGEASDRSVAFAVKPGMEFFFLCLILLLALDAFDGVY